MVLKLLDLHRNAVVFCFTPLEGTSVSWPLAQFLGNHRDSSNNIRLDIRENLFSE